MKTKLLICLAALLGVAAVDAVKERSTLPKLRITARVIDENGIPMSGARVSFVFGEPNNAKAIVKVEGVTQSDGLFTGEGYSDGSYGAGISKDGFYRSGLGAAPLSGIVNGRWEPWDKTYDAVLRPIGNPVPFYAKTGWFEIPAVGQPCGYDLEKGDWVAPHGKGAVADLVFTLDRRYTDRQNFDVKATLSFSNPLDGIQQAELPAIGRYSTFKWPRQAPEDGYQRSLETHFARDPKTDFTQSASEEQVYFFRVRTVEQNGRIVSALYGKIDGGLQLAPSNSQTSKVKLTYYLNPTSLDRNMEWDPKRNLLTGLSWEENPREP